ncbi:MAG: hypothetical protein ILM98_01690 [Kiritimatiellae bacterium]|nr:hypothetical protein [Kiritimatiellia bacterium]
MNDSTKVGLEVGIAATIIGVIGAFLAHESGDVNGYKRGLAEGVGSSEGKFRRLKEAYDNQDRQILALEDDVERLKQLRMSRL